MKNDKNNGSGFFFSSEKREAFEAACKEGGQKICDVKGTIDNKSYFADTEIKEEKCVIDCKEVSGMLSFPNSYSSKSGSNSVGGAVGSYSYTPAKSGCASSSSCGSAKASTSSGASSRSGKAVSNPKSTSAYSSSDYHDYRSSYDGDSSYRSNYRSMLPSAESEKSEMESIERARASQKALKELLEYEEKQMEKQMDERMRRVEIETEILQKTNEGTKISWEISQSLDEIEDRVRLGFSVQRELLDVSKKVEMFGSIITARFSKETKELERRYPRKKKSLLKYAGSARGESSSDSDTDIDDFKAEQLEFIAYERKKLENEKRKYLSQIDSIKEHISRPVRSGLACTYCGRGGL